MLTIKEYKGDIYYAGKYKTPREDYIRFEWSKGYLEMRKDCWDKLSKKKRAMILSAK